MPFTKSFAARIDSYTANNPGMNLTGANALTLTFVNRTASGGAGDLILEGGGIADPDTMVEIGGASYSFTLVGTGVLPTENRNGARQVPAEFKGDPVYLVSVYNYPAAGQSTRFAFLPDSDATLAEMDAFGNGAVEILFASFAPPPTPICFAEGTRLSTPRGPVAVEDLRCGDLICAVGGEHVPICWIDHTAHEWDSTPHKHKPILISAGSLGDGRPARDLIVSPQHRVLLECPEAGEPVLAPATALDRFPGIRRMNGKRHITYYHVALARHRVILAENAPCESFWPGPMALRALGPMRVRALDTALKSAGTSLASYGSPAFQFVTKGDLRNWTSLQVPPRAPHTPRTCAA